MVKHLFRRAAAEMVEQAVVPARSHHDQIGVDRRACATMVSTRLPSASMWRTRPSCRGSVQVHRRVGQRADMQRVQDRLLAAETIGDPHGQGGGEGVEAR